MQEPSSSNKQLGVGSAILIGHLAVNLPVLMIMLIFSGSGLFLAYLALRQFERMQMVVATIAFLIPAAIGFVTAWLWWSFSVPRWRRWALQNGAPADSLQKWAVLTGLVWPKGSFFEKTEFKLKD